MKCCRDGDATIPAKLIRDHVSGHTNLLVPRITILCELCLGEIMLDSQWSRGFKGRVDWLNDFFYSNDTTDPSIEQVLTAGFSALANMCPGCNGINMDEEEWRETLCDEKNWNGFLNIRSNKGRFPHISREHQKIVSLIASQSEYAKDFFGWLYCPSCTQKLELAEVDRFSSKELVSYRGLWLTESGREYFQSRVRGMSE